VCVHVGGGLKRLSSEQLQSFAIAFNSVMFKGLVPPAIKCRLSIGSVAQEVPHGEPKHRLVSRSHEMVKVGPSAVCRRGVLSF
jgi:hypothetical protein